MNNIGINNKIIINSISNSSEIKGNYKRISTSLLLCYNGLSEGLKSIALFLFYKYLHTMLYGDIAVQNGKRDDIRIYIDSYVDVKDIAMNIYSSKYCNTSRNSYRADISNIIQRLNQLDSDNIFYIWKYKKCRIFIIEREFLVWKYYNLCATVPPKTIRKILDLSQMLIQQMIRFLQQNNIKYNETDVQLSFAYFINSMVKRMNPLLISEIEPFFDHYNVFDYINKLKCIINSKDKFEMTQIDGIFFNRLPQCIAESILNNVRKLGGNEIVNKYSKQLTSELIPSTPHLVRRKRGMVKKNKKNIVTNTIDDEQLFHEKHRCPLVPEAKNYSEDYNPFEDSRKMVSYYRSFLRIKIGGKINFMLFENDVTYAAQILDVLSDNNRKDKVFLNAWLNYFVANYLKGDKKLRRKYTAMKIFLETFNEFSEKHFLSV